MAGNCGLAILALASYAVGLSSSSRVDLAAVSPKVVPNCYIVKIPAKETK